ncbi:hypothetical protein BC830DRAFT_1186041 [Chytriomyces sp. MP71]|nr:hypothetical protein BC830DRAFT_1186041 [Chytriomyces sp. MP71]
MDSEGKIVLTVGKADLLGEDCISKRFEVCLEYALCDFNTSFQFVKRVNVTCIPSAFSFASKVCGDPFSSRNLTLPIARVSSYTGNNLRPYIWREFLSNDSSLPPYYKLLQLIQSLGSEAESGSPSIDYCYFQELHRTQVNEILSRQFWPGIDVSEHLSIPDLSIIALYKRLVVGCGFILPNGYISFIMVRPGWQRAGIARFMLFHLIQSVQSYGKDITLHVSANNPAMLLYQHFGFKAEQFIVNFYDKYLPANSQDCKNAFFLRLRR